MPRILVFKSLKLVLQVQNTNINTSTHLPHVYV